LGILASLGGGPLLIAALLGIPELVLSWRKAVADESRTRSETLLNEAKSRQADLESSKLERELGPAAAIVPEANLTAEARRFGIEPAVGAHLANELMPVLAELTRPFAKPVTVSTGASGKSASAS
jgi:hypothetical protein